MSNQFNFFQQWYPLSPIEDLEKNRPIPVTVLGIHLVIWKPKLSNTFQVFLDQCPHRLAPLSEGRIDDKTGNLMCSYHGWQFDSKGICTHIPQAEKPEMVLKNQDNLCVTSFPVREEQDLLWVWLDANSADIAAITNLPLSPQVDASKGFVWSSFVRDLEYDWQTLVENVADPSHVPFAHHGVQGNRDRAKPILMQVKDSQADIIEVETVGAFATKITFEPPSRLEYAIQFGGEDKRMGLVTYCIPISPGKSRIVAQFPRNFAKRVHKLTPRWWDHINNRNLVIDGDMILLRQQEQLLQQRQNSESWKTAYKLPTGADRLVIEYRNWFDRYCAGKLPWEKVGLNGEIPQTTQSRQQTLDRYTQHTQHCSSCRGALKNIQNLQKFLLGYFAVSIAVVALLPDGMRLPMGLPLILLALLGLGGYVGLKFWLEPKFYFVDYVHAEK
jgi:phenylpropionate dioxygenase-like ring-hydroxylating dioxygenase large terminal subunit